MREYTVEEELEKLQQRCVSNHIARVADAVATNGDPCAVRVITVWTDFTYNHGSMKYFLSLMQQNAMVVDAKKVLVPATHLELGALPEPMPWRLQAHRRTKYPMWFCAKDCVGVGNAPTYFWL